ncbi:hypothetical protein V1264_007333 [Littorina saxatilis]|uniref:Uncharacterized protein n=1 Tax=Littorina saxatilis TaxID=31220 RepID=A0AAN9AV49_9CAEN
MHTPSCGKNLAQKLARLLHEIRPCLHLVKYQRTAWVVSVHSGNILMNTFNKSHYWIFQKLIHQKFKLTAASSQGVGFLTHMRSKSESMYSPESSGRPAVRPENFNVGYFLDTIQSISTKFGKMVYDDKAPKNIHSILTLLQGQGRRGHKCCLKKQLFFTFFPFSLKFLRFNTSPIYDI